MTAGITTLSSDRLTVAVNAVGAETHSLRDAAGRDYLWDGDPAWWTGRAPVLFPIVGAAPGNRVAFGAVETDMAKHGLARRASFDTVAQSETAVTHRLTADAATRRAYPFDFTLDIIHRLTGATLRVEALVRNRGDAPMPFGFGFHPAFRWPLPGAQGLAHLVTLENAAEPALSRIDAQGLLTRSSLPSPFDKGCLPLSHAAFLADAMIFLDGAGDALRYGPADGPGLCFRFENLPMLALWQKPGAPYLCIEPWHGAAAYADAGPQITARPGTQWLAPGHAASFAFEVTVERA